MADVPRRYVEAQRSLVPNNSMITILSVSWYAATPSTHQHDHHQHQQQHNHSDDNNGCSNVGHGNLRLLYARCWSSLDIGVVGSVLHGMSCCIKMCSVGARWGVCVQDSQEWNGIDVIGS